MKFLVIFLLFISITLAPIIADAGSFEGKWVIDLRSPDEKKNNVECGDASFDLTQNGSNIVGTHDFYTSYCGRVNEGGAVVGKAKGTKAILFVTGGRTGAIVKGRAEIKNGHLSWVTLKTIKAGEPKNDSPLILSKGVLSREKSLPSK